MSYNKVPTLVNAEKKVLKDSITQAINDLDSIINNSDTLTLEQAHQVIGKLAQHQKKIIKRLVQIEVS